MSEEDSLKRKKRIYKYFLDPTYKQSKVDPRTDKRWRNILSMTNTNDKLGIITFIFVRYNANNSIVFIKNVLNLFISNL